jgi:PhnB protein
MSGDRFASIRDPFGVRWTVMTRVEDLSEEESARGSPNGHGSRTRRPDEHRWGPVVEHR